MAPTLTLQQFSSPLFSVIANEAVFYILELMLKSIKTYEIF